MRESDKPLQVIAPASVRRILCEQFPIAAILSSFCGIEWRDIQDNECKIVGDLEIRCVALNHQDRHAIPSSRSATSWDTWLLTQRLVEEPVSFQMLAKLMTICLPSSVIAMRCF
jgi:hypothetical protein